MKSSLLFIECILSFLLVFSQNTVLVPDYGNVVIVYDKEYYANSYASKYIYNYAESGSGKKVLNLSHNWLGYWATNPQNGNWTFYHDYQGTASYTIPQDGYINFSYMMTSYYTGGEWSGYDSSKGISFGVWLIRNGQVTRLYEKSGTAGIFQDDGLTPVRAGDVLYYGALEKGTQLPVMAKIKFYPAYLKKVS